MEICAKIPTQQKESPKKRCSNPFFSKRAQYFELWKQAPESSHQTGSFNISQNIGTLILSQSAFLCIVSCFRWMAKLWFSVWGLIGFLVLSPTFLALCCILLLAKWKINYLVLGHYQFFGQDGPGTWKKSSGQVGYRDPVRAWSLASGLTKWSRGGGLKH